MNKTNSPNIDVLWNNIFQKYVDVFYQELMLDNLVSKWENFDLITRYLIAITASGSAVSGWALWQFPYGIISWKVLSFTSALLAIFYSVAPIAHNLKLGNQAYTEARLLRSNFEDFIYDFQAYKGDTPRNFTEELRNFNTTFNNICEKSPRFPFVTKSFRVRVQKKLNKELQSKGFYKD